jgi:RNA polymerase sigma-70 factor (ECF subfamily)
MSEPTDPPPPADPDLDLLRRARVGDFVAFEQLVGRFQGRVYGLAYRVLGEPHDAEDVTQQTFLSLVEHLRGFREESAVAAWVLRIAANHALKLLRKRRGLPTVPLAEPGGEDEGYADVPHPEFIAPWRDDPADLAERHEVRGLIDRALAELDDKYRAVFVLRDVEGLSVREAAELLGISEANVKVRLLRARLALREKLTRVLGDEAARVYPDHRHP